MVSRFSIYLLGSVLLYLAFMGGSACTHIMDDDGMTPIDTMPIDTGVTNPCPDDRIIFEKEILPILRSNCAQSGCHNRASAEDRIILESYDDLVQSRVVTPFDLNDSDLFEAIVEDDLDKRMPPSPRSPLTSAQINTISTWILQGAENIICDDPEECKTENISFRDDVQPIINLNCIGCHSSATANGGIKLETYTQIKQVADAGLLAGVIEWRSGFTRMPLNGDQLDSCSINLVNIWINEGAQNN